MVDPLGATGGAVAPFDDGSRGALVSVHGASALSSDGNMGSWYRSYLLISAFRILSPAQGLMRRKVRIGATWSRKTKLSKNRMFASSILIGRDSSLLTSFPDPLFLAKAGREPMRLGPAPGFPPTLLAVLGEQLALCLEIMSLRRAGDIEWEKGALTSRVLPCSFWCICSVSEGLHI